MLTMLSGTGSGFIFWLIAAKYYSPEDVGFAAATLSAVGLLSMFTRFGFEISIIKYLPLEENKNSMINSCLNLIVLSSVLIGLIFIYGLDIFSPNLLFLRDKKYLVLSFITFIAASSLFSFQNNIYVALRDPKYSFYQSLICTSRILALPILIFIGFLGIYLAYGIGLLIAVIFGNLYVRKLYSSYRLLPYVQSSVLSKMIHFSLGNYIATLFEVLPSFLLPILVINILGAELNAYYYIAWSFSTILLMVPKASAMSLFAEGLYFNDDIHANFFKTLKFVFILTIPLILGVFLFGNYMLSTFGRGYSENALGMLEIFAVATIPSSLNIVYLSIKRINKKMNSVILINFVLALITIVGSYLLMQKIGLFGIGTAWLLANVVVNLLIGIEIFKLKWENNRNQLNLQDSLKLEF